MIITRALSCVVIFETPLFREPIVNKEYRALNVERCEDGDGSKSQLVLRRSLGASEINVRNGYPANKYSLCKSFCFQNTSKLADMLSGDLWAINVKCINLAHIGRWSESDPLVHLYVEDIPGTQNWGDVHDYTEHCIDEPNACFVHSFKVNASTVRVS